jgi:hypothetical protein
MQMRSRVHSPTAQLPLTGASMQRRQKRGVLVTSYSVLIYVLLFRYSESGNEQIFLTLIENKN